METPLITREVLFRESEFVPVFPLPSLDDDDDGGHSWLEGDEGAGGFDGGEDDLMDVEFVVRGDLDGDGNQELIFASIDGSLVIIKSRGGNQYHFQYPGTLPLDDLVCGIDIGPIYHHHSYTATENIKTTANGVYVLTLDGTLLILSVEELKFLPSSPHYDYKCYDTSDIDSGTTKEIQKSIFTGVAMLKVLLEIRPGGIVSSPAQPPLDIPSNCTCLRVLDDRTCQEGTLGNLHAGSVMIAMGGRDRVHLFAYDLFSMCVNRVCESLPVDSEVHSLDLFSHKTFAVRPGTSIITNFLVAGTKTGTVLCWKVPAIGRGFQDSAPPSFRSDSSGLSSSDTRVSVEAGATNPEATVIPVRLGSGPPSPEAHREAGPAYIRMLPPSSTLGIRGDQLFNQDPHFIVAWLDGRVGICKIEKRESRFAVSGFNWNWSILQCLSTSETLYKADYFDQALFRAPPSQSSVYSQHVVSCAVTSWTGCTYLFTIKLPVHMQIQGKDKDREDNAETGESASGGSDYESKPAQEHKGGEKNADDSDADTVSEEESGEDSPDGSRPGLSPRIRASFDDDDTVVATESLELSASHGGGGSGNDLFKERLSGDETSPILDTVTSTSITSADAGAGARSTSPLPDDDGGNELASPLPPSVEDVDTRDDSLIGHDNVLYSFDSRVLTGASASRDFCCARQGDSQALIYISVSGMCTAIPNVSEQIKTFLPKVHTAAVT